MCKVWHMCHVNVSQAEGGSEGNRVGSGWCMMSCDRRRCKRETRWQEQKWKAGGSQKHKGFPLQKPLATLHIHLPIVYAVFMQSENITCWNLCNAPQTPTWCVRISVAMLIKELKPSAPLLSNSERLSWIMLPSLLSKFWMMWCGNIILSLMGWPTEVDIKPSLRYWYVVPIVWELSIHS